MSAITPPNNQTPGFPCPKCQFSIRIGMEELLSQSEFICPGCGMQLTLDREASRESLEHVQNLNVAMKNLESMRKQDL